MATPPCQSQLEVSELDDLWNSASASHATFDATKLAPIPAIAMRYLVHAIAPGARLAAGVRLRMHGTIKLKTWSPFSAEQVIVWNRGFIWRARAKIGAISISGSDRFVDGRGAMRWKLLGLLPFLSADGPDITRSAAGRLGLEAFLLPSVLVGAGTMWSAADERRVHATFGSHGQPADVDYDLGDDGSLRTASGPRWGNPDGAGFKLERFGGVFAREQTFGEYTIPVEMRVGWYFDTPRFESEGEFFRATIDSAEYR